MMIGANQNFLRALIKSQRSFRNSNIRTASPCVWHSFYGSWLDRRITDAPMYDALGLFGPIEIQAHMGGERHRTLRRERFASQWHSSQTQNASKADRRDATCWALPDPKQKTRSRSPKAPTANPDRAATAISGQRGWPPPLQTSKRSFVGLFDWVLVFLDSQYYLAVFSVDFKVKIQSSSNSSRQSPFSVHSGWLDFTSKQFSRTR